jgi:hypothetical protein
MLKFFVIGIELKNNNIVKNVERKKELLYLLQWGLFVLEDVDFLKLNLK